MSSIVPYLVIHVLAATLAGSPDGSSDPTDSCYPVADVTFLLDGSDSISDQEFSQQKDFLRRFVKVSDVASDRIRVGFAVVSSTIGDTLSMSGTLAPHEIIRQIGAIRQPQEGSRTDLGLVHLGQMLTEGRKAAVKIGVVLTDGRAKDERATEREAAAVKSVGTFLISVGVGRLIKDQELEKLASTPSNAYRLLPVDRSIKLLTETINYLGRKWCTIGLGAGPRESNATPAAIVQTNAHLFQTVLPTDKVKLDLVNPLVTTAATTESTTAAWNEPAFTESTVGQPNDSGSRDRSSLVKNDQPKLRSSLQKQFFTLPLSQWGIVTHQLFNFDGPAESVPLKHVHIAVKPTTTTRPNTPPTTSSMTATSSSFDEHGHDSTVLTHDHNHDVSGLCMNSRFVDGVGYTFHANSCTEFLQCYFQDGHVTVEVARCPFRTFFDERHMICRPYDQHACYRDPCFDFNVVSYGHNGNCRAHWTCDTGLSRPKCCPVGLSFSPGEGCVADPSCTDPCTETGELTFTTPFASCRMTPLETNDQFYFEKIPGLGMMIRTCPRGSRFEASLCTCDTSEEVVRDECRPKMYLDFKDGFIDKSGNNLALSHTNVLIERGAGRFLRDSQMKLWRFSGVSFGHNLAITLRFKVNGTARKGEAMHLVSNCCSGCNGVPGPSVDLVVLPDEAGGIVMFSARTKTSGERFVDVPYKSPASGWNDVSYHYNGQALIGSVNGVEARQHMAGAIESREDPLTIASCNGSGSFRGLIDEVKIYLCSPR